MTPEVDGPGLPRVLATTALGIVIGVMPVFLVGALAVFVRRDLGFSELQHGLLVSMFWTSSAVFAVPGGRLCERVGAERAMSVSALLSVVVLASVALLARSWGHLLGLMALSGLANAMSQPATNLALARHVPSRRRGVAFGIKQAAMPTGTLLAGIAVPLLALRLHWRWAFAAAILLAVVFWVVVPRGAQRLPPASGAPGRPRRHARAGDAATRHLALIAVAAAFAVSGANSLGGFFVESATSQGVDAGAAGLWFAAGSASGICARILYGVVADRADGVDLRAVAVLLCIGAPGMTALGFAASPVVLGVGTVLAFAAGWGWNGLFNYAVVRENPNAPGAASGIAAVGLFAGGSIGPAAFGAVVSVGSYRLAWMLMAAWALLAAGLMLVGHRLLRRAAARRATGAA